MTLADAVVLLYSLKRDRSSGHEKPHKPVLLLAVLDLVETGEITTNQIPPIDRLRELFTTYFEIVRQGNDNDSPNNPFFHLTGEDFWNLQMVPGEPPIYRKGQTKAPSWSGLQRLVAHAVIDPGLFALMLNPADRELLREAIISRYFANHRDAIRHICMENTRSTKEPLKVAEGNNLPGRDAGFRKVVTEIYEYRCAACGIHIHLRSFTMVEAAHLIPWSVKHDDHPRNGMALCPNHHHAMDEHLIAPTPDRIWHASPLLDRRRGNEGDLLALDGKPVLEPKDRRFLPAEESLAWRAKRLLA